MSGSETNDPHGIHGDLANGDPLRRHEFDDNHWSQSDAMRVSRAFADSGKVAFPTKHSGDTFGGKDASGGTAWLVWRHVCVAAQRGGMAAKPGGIAKWRQSLALRRHSW